MLAADVLAVRARRVFGLHFNENSALTVADGGFAQHGPQRRHFSRIHEQVFVAQSPVG